MGLIYVGLGLFCQGMGPCWGSSGPYTPRQRPSLAGDAALLLGRVAYFGREGHSSGEEVCVLVGSFDSSREEGHQYGSDPYYSREERPMMGTMAPSSRKECRNSVATGPLPW